MFLFRSDKTKNKYPVYPDIKYLSINDLHKYTKLWFTPWSVYQHEGKYYLPTDLDCLPSKQGTFTATLVKIDDLLTVDCGGREISQYPFKHFNLIEWIEVQLMKPLPFDD